MLSSGANDGAPTISPDLRALYFERTNGNFTAIVESRKRYGHWQPPRLASFSGSNSDQQPAFAPDGSYLIYVSSRAEVRPGGTVTSVSHLYRVDRRARGWSDPVVLPSTVNFSNRVFKPSLAANGDVYFMADIGAGSAPRWRLFVSRQLPDGYARAEALPFSGPDDGDVDPYIAPDQSYLIFSSNTRGVILDGHEHLFITRRTESGWSSIAAIRYQGDTMGADDGEAQVSPDGETLYFTSSRVVTTERPRTLPTALAALSLLNRWNNSNTNIWTLPMAAVQSAAVMSDDGTLITEESTDD